MKNAFSALALTLSFILLNLVSFSSTSYADASPLQFTVTCISDEKVPSFLIFTYDDASGKLVTGKKFNGLSVLYYHDTLTSQSKVIQFYNDGNGTIDLFVDTGLRQIAGRGVSGGSIQLTLTVESTQKHSLDSPSAEEHAVITYKLLSNQNNYSQLGEPVPALCSFNANKSI